MNWKRNKLGKMVGMLIITASILSGPELYYPRVRIQSSKNDVALGNATVYRKP